MCIVDLTETIRGSKNVPIADPSRLAAVANPTPDERISAGKIPTRAK